MKKIILIDGSALFYRSYFAMIRNPLINSKGENTSAIYGFTRSILSLLKEDFDGICVIFDTDKPTFRHERYKEYKATRDKMPDDMRPQFPIIVDIIKAMKIPVITKEGYEADDILGSFASHFSKKDIEVYIYGVDKDFQQLLQKNVYLYNYKTKEITSEEDFEQDKGIKPVQFIDVLALMGDSSDNIPGVPKIGEKRAYDLIKKFGSCEKIYRHLDAVTPKSVKESLVENQDILALSKELVTIKTDIEVLVDENDIKIDEPDKDALQILFEKCEFSSLMKELDIEQRNVEIKSEKSSVNTNRLIISSEQELEKIAKELAKQKFIVIDTETDDTNPVFAELVGMSIAYNEKASYYIPFAHKEEDIKNLSLDNAKKIFNPIFENEKILKIGQNIKYDKIVLEKYFSEIKGIAFDTMLASYLLDPEQNQHNLDYLAEKYLKYTTIKYKELMGTGQKQLNMKDVTVDYVKDYACEDVDTAFALYDILDKQVKKENLQDLMEKMEIPLIEVLAEIEKAGVKIDVDKFHKLAEETNGTLEELTAKIYEIAGEDFNIRSTKQMQYILFEKLNLPPQKKTKTGYSTDEKVLTTLAAIHEVPRLILEYRELEKMRSTYIEALPQMIYAKTGRIHSSFNQTVAATGRLSSSNPNLQNIPIRSDLGKKIREGFIAEAGNLLIAADYSQIELRIMAHYSEDENMTRAFNENLDIHAKTASLLFDKNIEEISSDDRRMAKIVNFGVLYGMGAFKFSQDLGVSRKAAQEFIDNYFARFPKIKSYMDSTIAFAEEKGYVETLFGRKRWLKDINARNKNIKGHAERTALNMPIQGTAADIIKKAMIEIYQEIKEKKLPIKMIMQIHDELVFEVAENDAEKYGKWIKEKMENVFSLKVPLIVDVGTGKNWLEAH